MTFCERFRQTHLNQLKNATANRHSSALDITLDGVVFGDIGGYGSRAIA